MPLPKRSEFKNNSSVKIQDYILDKNLRKLVITVHEKKIPFKNFIKIYGIDSILLLLDESKPDKILSTAKIGKEVINVCDK